MYQNLYAWWKLNEGSGTTTVDYSGNGRNGVVAGTPVWSAQGKNGGAIEFDGVDDMVTYSMTETTLAAYSVSLWVKVSNVNTTGYAGLFNNNSTGSDMQLDTDGGNPGVYQYRGDSIVTMSTVSLNWVHLTASYDGATTKLYMNGGLVGETAGGGGNVFGQLQLGVNRTLNIYFSGTIDDLMVWDRALSASDAAEISGGVSSYSDYMTQYNLTGPDANQNADPDGDGVSNLGEWAMGQTDPTERGDRPTTTPVITTIDVSDEYVEFSWLHRLGGVWNGAAYEFGGITYQPEGSLDLATWSVGGSVILGVNPLNLPAPPPGFEWATTRHSLPLTPTGRRFLRLNILGSP